MARVTEADPVYGEVPKIIWSYWASGWSTAPATVKLAVASWERTNPDYTVRLLDEGTVGKWIEMSRFPSVFPTLAVSHQADFIRLALLKKWGGVWLDATVFCRIPLNVWLPEMMRSGFLAVENTRNDRMLCNWFLAATPEHPFVRAWLDSATGFFAKKSWAPPSTIPSRISRFARSLGRSPAWTSPWTWALTARIIPAYPYFIFHYLANRLLRARPSMSRRWVTPLCSSHQRCWDLKTLHRVRADIDPSVISSAIELGDSPVYKLTYKRNAAYGAFWEECITQLESWLVRQPLAEEG